MTRSYGLNLTPKILKPIIFSVLAFTGFAITGCENKPVLAGQYPPASSSEISEYDITWHILSQLEEPAFSRRSGKVKSRYRFVWYPALTRTPLIIRIERQLGDKLLMLIKFANGPPDHEIEIMGLKGRPELKGYKMSVKIDKTINLSTDEFIQIESLFAKLNLCGPPPKSGGVLDGANWLFEYEEDGKHCAHNLHSPRGLEHFELGDYLINLARLSQIELF